MDSVLFIGVIAAMVAVLAVLFLGIFSMARGGEYSRRNSNRLMRWRVALQALAVLLFIIFVFFARN